MMTKLTTLVAYLDDDWYAPVQDAVLHACAEPVPREHPAELGRGQLAPGRARRKEMAAVCT